MLRCASHRSRNCFIQLLLLLLLLLLLNLTIKILSLSKERLIEFLQITNSGRWHERAKLENKCKTITDDHDIRRII